MRMSSPDTGFVHMAPSILIQIENLNIPWVKTTWLISSNLLILMSHADVSCEVCPSQCSSAPLDERSSDEIAIEELAPAELI